MFADISTLVKDDTIVDGSFDSEFEFDFVDIVELNSIMSWTSFWLRLNYMQMIDAPVCSVLASYILCF